MKGQQEMAWKPINLNDKVRVKLTDMGRDRLVSYCMIPDRCRDRAITSADICYPGWRGGDWVVFKLFEMAHIFGPDMHSFASPIEPPIEILVEKTTTGRSKARNNPHFAPSRTNA